MLSVKKYIDGVIENGIRMKDLYESGYTLDTYRMCVRTELALANLKKKLKEEMNK